MNNKHRLIVVYRTVLNTEYDDAIFAAAAKHGGTLVGGSVWLDDLPERDLEFEIDKNELNNVVEELGKITGFGKLEIRV